VLAEKWAWANTLSNSVAEHLVMSVLALVLNYLPSPQWVLKGGWNIAECIDPIEPGAEGGQGNQPNGDRAKRLTPRYRGDCCNA
jgi:hypothetical protein